MAMKMLDITFRNIMGIGSNLRIGTVLKCDFMNQKRHSTYGKDDIYKVTLKNGSFLRSRVIPNCVEWFIENNGLQGDEQENDDSFGVLNLDDVCKKWQRWNKELPHIKPFYAVKCNPDPAIIMLLKMLGGTGFDCASKEEIEKCLNLGVSPNDIIYANPCKPISHLKFAHKNNIEKMTFDNEDELVKIHKIFPEARLILRIRPPIYKECKVTLSKKFGANPGEETLRLLQKATNLGLSVIGICFHVGWICSNIQAYTAALEASKEVYDQAIQNGHNITIIDIGGGFSGNKEDGLNFSEVAKSIKVSANALFPPHVNLVAEPGTYFVDTSCHILTQIIGKRKDIKTNEMHYYINQSIYGALASVVENLSFGKFEKVDQNEKQILDSNPKYLSSVYGWTCCGNDVLAENIMLPEYDIGDWLIYPNAGAYSFPMASSFNGYKKTHCYTVMGGHTWRFLHRTTKE